MAACSFLYFVLRDSLAIVNRPCSESCGFQYSGVYNADKGSLESHDYLGPENSGGVVVQNKSMTADFSDVCRTLASWIFLI